MAEIKRSALMPYPARVMYDIVNDVDSYPEFLPWCGASRVEQSDEHSMVAAILMQTAGLNHWFKTRNRLVPGERIDISLVEGPFSKLEGHWRFSPLDAAGCKIELTLQFEFKGRLLSAIASQAFSRIADTMVESFCNRARDLHGR